ncbi:MAG: alkaline phosphatase family protein [Dehalococcoidia bacterium]
MNLLLALVNSPVWSKTLFLVLYDEHGGMFDHEPPFRVPNVAQVGGEEFDFYGVRVPALVASPWVPRCSVSSIVFDHTSIISTILQRFCRGANGSVPSRHRGNDGVPPRARPARGRAMTRPALLNVRRGACNYLAMPW